MSCLGLRLVAGLPSRTSYVSVMESMPIFDSAGTFYGDESGSKHRLKVTHVLDAD